MKLRVTVYTVSVCPNQFRHKQKQPDGFKNVGILKNSRCVIRKRRITRSRNLNLIFCLELK
jgi:hypothetical protein